MTNHELQILALGTNLGVAFTLAVHFIGQAMDDRREARTDQAALNQARKFLATSDWREALTTREPA
ncbi:hypothetical protein HRW07_10075 [Streptomyces lunaelactis]|uniref:hypothetical protein n=1 Tax=Streptomyces lunaelactis TaxID=1535768 RepID=UPI0015851D3F|nr:hypothetical protein [Streptomyces lunaelactis]NUL03575.1 hypothetical protein [Streptomyces lunaelactis]